MLQRMSSMGYVATPQPCRVGEVAVRNVIGERRGTEESQRVIVIGAHYDAVVGSPGVDDNASGGRCCSGSHPCPPRLSGARRCVSWRAPLGEPPFYCSRNLGSGVYGSALRERGRADRHHGLSGIRRPLFTRSGKPVISLARLLVALAVSDDRRFPDDRKER